MAEETKKIDKHPEPPEPITDKRGTEPKVILGEPEASEIKIAPKVRITPGGGYKTASFKGKLFTSKGAVHDVADLGWSESDWAAAHKDPGLVIEPLDEDGNVPVDAEGKPTTTVRAPGSQRRN